MDQRRGRPIFPINRRPLTLGEILMREEMREQAEREPPPRSMGRVMSPTRRLGPLANGRPRRPRRRAMSRPSTSAGPSDEDNQQRRRRAPSAPVPSSRLTRWRSSTGDGRPQNIRPISVVGRQARRRGIPRSTRGRHNRSPDLFYVPFGWHRNSAGGRAGPARMRAQTASASRSARFSGGRQRVPRHAGGFGHEYGHSPRVFRSAFGHSHFMRSSGRPRRGFLRRGASDTRRTATATVTATATATTTTAEEDAEAMNRFIEFAAEFIPVNPHPPDAEPPEWSLDITAADFGPFAIGRSAISRARSLAMIAVLSQVDDSEANHQPNFDED